jgi:predicted amidohydrolase
LENDKKNDNPLRVAAVQMDIELGNRVRNLERLAGFARRAAGGGARLTVFPECTLTGYAFESRDEAREHAETIPGPSTAAVAEICRELDLYVVFGLIERADSPDSPDSPDGERLFNALALVGPGGVLASYRKIHLPHIGLDHFVDPGDRPFAVHETPLCRIGMSICYDGAFPESARVLALGGAELVVLPTNWPPGAEEFALYGINARALENAVYYLAADRVGEERGFRFIGLSRIVDVDGRSLAEADGESEVILTATIDPARARQKRVDRVPGKHWIDRFADRRPEFYGSLVEPH